jgi:hypothetical protein
MHRGLRKYKPQLVLHYNLWWYIEGGGYSKSCVIGNLSSETSMGTTEDGAILEYYT